MLEDAGECSGHERVAGSDGVDDLDAEALVFDELLAVVRERWGAGPGFVWTESFIDNTDPEIDRAALLQEENLLGDFLRLAETDDETTLEEFRRAMGEVFDDPRIRRFMDAPTDEQLREWIRAAERLGIDRLLKGNE